MKPCCSSLRTLLALLALALLAGCDSGTGGEDAGRSKANRRETQEPLLVRTATPELRDMDRTLEITGEVHALVKATVSSRISGVPIVEVLRDVGDRVKAGDPLVSLEDLDLDRVLREARVKAREAEVKVTESEFALKELEAEARGQAKTLAQKKKTYERLVAQEAQGAAAGMDLDEARTAYDQELAQAERLAIQIEKAKIAVELAKLARDTAALQVEKARRDLSDARVKAPFDGIISARDANIGQIVTGSGGTLFEIFDPDSLVIDAHIPQRNLSDVKAGLPVVIKAEALPGRTIAARIAMVSPVVEEDTGTVLVRIAPEDPALLQPGIFVSGRIILETRRDALTLPRKAVAYERERPFVYLVEALPEGGGHRVRRIWFKEGLADGEHVEFLPAGEGPEFQLHPGDPVVLVGIDRLNDGDPVRLETPRAMRGSAEADTAGVDGGK